MLGLGCLLSNNIYTYLIPVLRRIKRRSIVDQGRTTGTVNHFKPDSKFNSRFLKQASNSFWCFGISWGVLQFSLVTNNQITSKEKVIKTIKQ
jgi:hypothetical protein